MTSPPNPTKAGILGASGGTGKRFMTWQVLQVALLLGLFGVGMYEVDLDAKCLAESRARASLLSAIEAGPRGAPLVRPDPDVERLVEAYAKACRECASVAKCQDAIRLLRGGNQVPGHKGPCKVGILDRWSADSQPRTDRK
jgi:hypothetical protein